MNYSIVPFKSFYCTQNYNQAPTHYKQSQSTNGVKAYPIDIVDDVYCGCDEMVVVKINGVGTRTVNQIFVQSTSPVKMPIGQYYITYLITHPNDDDIKNNIYVGKKYKRHDFIIHKGTDGGVGAHIDFVIAKSKQAGWVMSSYNEYVLPDSIKPEDGMYIDESFTKMVHANGLSFKKLSKLQPVSEDKLKNQVKVICGENTLYIRDKAGLHGNILGFAVPGIYNVMETSKSDGYTWYRVDANIWFANPSGCTEELSYYSQDQLPIGSVIKIIGSSIPKNYLLCDGSSFDANSYKDLFKVLKNSQLPKLEDASYIKCLNISNNKV